MFGIQLNDVGKRYRKQWIFRHVSHTFNPHTTTALIGNNGSGKSTLLHVIYNFITRSEGQVQYILNDTVIEEDALHQLVAFAAPYLEIPEEFTLRELCDWHFRIRTPRQNSSLESMIERAGLHGHEDKVISNYSSGMKQRVKLILAFHTDCPLLLLDEPCSNFDEIGIAWYREEMMKQHHQRTIIIASNQRFEFDFGDAALRIEDYKSVNKA